jgi:thioredoxin 1
MGTRSIRLFTVLAALALSAGPAMAQVQAQGQAHETFTSERFAALQAEKAIILLDVFADWCPTCAQQQKVLADYRERNPDTPIHFLRIDFDSQKQYVTRFRAPRQSTLIVYHGEERIWFSVAETSSENIFKALNDAAARATR